jgi:aryl sulfotransferase
VFNCGSATVALAAVSEPTPKEGGPTQSLTFGRSKYTTDMQQPSAKVGRRPDSAGSGPLELLEEVRTSSARTINAHLAAAGFGDISRDGLIALGLLAMDGVAPSDVAGILEISTEAAGEMADALVEHGYLRRDDPPDGGRQKTVLTSRGMAAITSGRAGVVAARWTDFPFRGGDIVISTAPKSGTTWAQTICGLLIFQTPSLPASIADLSPFMDWGGQPRDQVHAQLAAQTHRRFIKTHQPISVIPDDPRVTFIVVARHPLDAALSFYYHLQLVGDAGKARPPHQNEDPREWLLHQIDALSAEGQAPGRFLANALRVPVGAWPRRDEPNVVLLHYEDLSADLPGEMGSLADRLGITVPESAWPDLVDAATFEGMRSAADRLRPLRELDGLADSQAGFFRQGTSGGGRALLTKPELARYHALAARLAPPALLEWLHRDDGSCADTATSVLPIVMQPGQRKNDG